MPLLDKMKKATQDVVRGTKEFTDIARQNSLIADEQRQIAGLYSQIGKLYFETHEADPETELGKLCLAIIAANERIGKCNETISQIKGNKRCPSCGADIPITSAFCGVCGAKTTETAEVAEVDATKRRCSNCGAELEEGVMFCTSCGQKQE